MDISAYPQQKSFQNGMFPQSVNVIEVHSHDFQF